MSKIKAIVLDIDGTLYSSNKEITPKTKEALLKAQRNGIKLVLASGRPTNGLYHIAEELDMNQNHGLLISHNGSKVVDCNNGEILYNKTVPLEETKSVIKHITSLEGTTVMIENGSDMYVTDKDGYLVDYETQGGGFNAVEDRELANNIDFETNKILISAEPERLKELSKELEEPFKDVLSGAFSAPFYFEYTALGVDKGQTMKLVLADLGIHPDEIISFGDAYNDISMLEMAGIGVAMGNSVPEVKELADYITADHDHDGIAEALVKLNII